MIDEWRSQLPPGKTLDVPGGGLQRYLQDWDGKIPASVCTGRKVLGEQTRSCEVAALGQASLRFPCAVPNEPGDYQLKRPCCEVGWKPCAACAIFKVGGAENNQGEGVARGKPVKASSTHIEPGTDCGLDPPWTGSPIPAGPSNSAESPMAQRSSWGSAVISPRGFGLGNSSAPKPTLSRSLWMAPPQQRIPRPTAHGRGGDQIRAPTSARWVTGTNRPPRFAIRSREMRVFP